MLKRISLYGPDLNIKNVIHMYGYDNDEKTYTIWYKPYENYNPEKLNINKFDLSKPYMWIEETQCLSVKEIKSWVSFIKELDINLPDWSN